MMYNIQYVGLTPLNIINLRLIMSNKKLSDFSEFKRRSRIAHEKDYNYVKYDWENRKVYIEIDGIVYKQIIYEHVKGSLPKEYKKYLTFLELKETCKKFHGKRFELSEYIDFNKVVKVYDTFNNKVYYQKPTHINQGCLPKASLKKYTKEVFIESCNDLHNNKFSYENYSSIHKPVDIIYNKTGKRYTMIAYNHLRGSVPKELSLTNISKQENILVKELLKIDPNLNYLTSYRPKWLKRKELDIYLPDYNIAIEFNGTLYHHSSKNVPRPQLLKYSVDEDYHINKSKLCLENNVKLIHIFDFQLKTLNLKETLEKYRTSNITIGNNKFIFVNHRTLETSSKKENENFLRVYYPEIIFN